MFFFVIYGFVKLINGYGFFFQQLDVFHPLMFRIYSRKYDMEEPPKLEEPLDECDSRYKRIKQNRAAEQDKEEKALEAKFYRFVFFFFLAF